MYSSIEINGKPVQLKASLYAHLLYKQVFGKELAAAASRIGAIIGTLKGDDPEGDEALIIHHTDEEIAELFGEYRMLHYQLLWTFVKAADRKLPPFEDWLADIEDIDFVEMNQTLTKLITDTVRIDRKNAQAAAVQTTDSQE